MKDCLPQRFFFFLKGLDEVMPKKYLVQFLKQSKY